MFLRSILCSPCLAFSQQKLYNAASNIRKCDTAISLEMQFQQCIYNNLQKNKCPFINIDDDLLQLASGNATKGVFFCVLLEVKLDDSRGMLRLQYFESGCFENFTKNVVYGKLSEQFTACKIGQCSTYTPQDVELERNRRDEMRGGCKNPGII